MSARTDLFRVDAGTGEPVVLVHGSWTDHAGWLAVQAALAERYRVVAYDRRGHSRSGPPDGTGSRRTHEDDLIALVESLDAGPVHLVGNSFGGSIVLGVAGRRPDLVRTVAAHEPPLTGVRGGPGLARLVGPVTTTAERVVDLVRAGRAAAAAERFVDEVALGPGAWSMLPAPVRDVMAANAPTFVEMLEAPGWDAPAVIDPSVPVLLTCGDTSPAWLLAVADAVAEVLDVRRLVLRGAGHVPHLTHPAETAAALVDWFDTAQVTGGARR